MRPSSGDCRLPIVGLLLVVGGVADARGEKVPDVVLGPAALEVAPRIEVPIAEVTVFSDRARVRRRARVAGKGGVSVVRLPDLPGATFLDTIRLAASGARVLRVEATPIERDRAGIEQASKLLDDLDVVVDRIVELGDRQSAESWEVDLLGRLRPAAPVPEDKREGRKPLAVDVGSWFRALDFLGQRSAAARGRMARLTDERRELVQRRNRLTAEIQTLNRGGFSDRVVSVVGVLEVAAAGSTEVQLEYFVPGARWKPVYDLHFAPGRGQLRVETAAVVDQTTGEDWEKATLSFSTALPGRGIDLPELLTWTLGERSDFLPSARPRRPPPSEPALPVPVPRLRVSGQQDDAGDDRRSVAVAMIRERLAAAASGEQGTYAAAVDDESDHGDAKVAVVGREVADAPAPQRPMPRVVTTSGVSRSSGLASAAPAPAAAPPPSEAWADTSNDMALESQSRARKSKSDNLSSRASTTTVPLALHDTPASSRVPVLTDPLLPGVSAGGLDFVYQAASAAPIPSTGKQVRIPLDARTFRTGAFYQATPALATTAFLRARVRNDGQRPLLRGAVAIFSDGEFVGQGEIQTTGPGGDVEFPLGADQDIRLVRQVVPHSKTTGLIMKTDETEYQVQIQVGNYKKQAVTIEVVDQIPRSRKDKVDVKLLSTEPAALAAPDADGLLRWRLDLPAGSTRTIKLRYQISRPAGWILYQP